LFSFGVGHDGFVAYFGEGGPVEEEVLDAGVSALEAGEVFFGGEGFGGVGGFGV